MSFRWIIFSFFLIWPGSCPYIFISLFIHVWLYTIFVWNYIDSLNFYSESWFKFPFFLLNGSYCPFKLLCESLTRQLFWLRQDFRDFLDFYSFNVCPFYITCQPPLSASFLTLQTKRKVWLLFQGHVSFVSKGVKALSLFQVNLWVLYWCKISFFFR